ncbi:glycosyltransferase family 39 protein [Patescibacteria group bacterium]
MNKTKKFLLTSFLSWRILLFIFVFIGAVLLPLQTNHLGGGRENYVNNPLVWSFLNFDGEHFLSLARIGYQPLTYYFFPLYPILVRFSSKFFGGMQTDFAISGLLISNISFFIAILGLWKLVKLDFKKNIAINTILLLLLFPTSFYFGSFYSESLFLALVVWSFYFARKRKWLLASLLAGLSSATRLVGIVMLPSLLAEYYLKNKGKKKFFSLNLFLIVLFSFLGLIIYLIYLQKETGDFMIFINTVDVFGDQRSSNIIALPQVFYRYIFKILPNLSFSFMPGVYTAFLEFFVGLGFLYLFLYSLEKLRFSYFIFLFGTYLIPTLSGSFSSLPRYVLISFPGFIILGKLMSKLPTFLKIIIFTLLLILLTITTALFSRGYWIS